MTSLLSSLSLGIQEGGWLCPVPPGGSCVLDLPSVTQVLHLSLLWALESNRDGDSFPLKVLLVAHGHPVRSPVAQLRASMEWEEMVLGSWNPLRAWVSDGTL